MKQRLGIAAALIGDPGILIFDEPLNGLDPEGIRWARTLMRNLAAEGRTVLFSSHLMGEMELTADQLIVIHQGRLLADQPLPDFVSAHATEHVQVRTPNRAGLSAALARAGLTATPAKDSDDGLEVEHTTSDRVGHIAATLGIELSELTVIRDSLEDAFLSMTTTEQNAA